MADSVCVLPGTPPSHGTPALCPPDRGLLADAPHPQRSQRPPRGTRRPPGDHLPLQNPLPEAGVPVHQMHGGVVQQVQGGAGDAAQPRGPAQAVAPGGHVAPRRVRAALPVQLAVLVQHVVVADAEQRELQRIFLGEIEQREKNFGIGRRAAAGTGKGGGRGRRGAGIAGGSRGHVSGRGIAERFT